MSSVNRPEAIYACFSRFRQCRSGHARAAGGAGVNLRPGVGILVLTLRKVIEEAPPDELIDACERFAALIGHRISQVLGGRSAVCRFGRAPSFSTPRVGVRARSMIASCGAITIPATYRLRKSSGLVEDPNH